MSPIYARKPTDQNSAADPTKNAPRQLAARPWRQIIGAALSMILLALSACAVPPVVLRHPSTGLTVECRAGGAVPGSRAAYQHQRDCVEDYQRQGYERVPR